MSSLNFTWSILEYLDPNILWKNLKVLVYAKMAKSRVYHDVTIMILALDHPTWFALPFFNHFLSATQCPAFILSENVRDRIPGCSEAATRVVL